MGMSAKVAVNSYHSLYDQLLLIFQKECRYACACFSSSQNHTAKYRPVKCTTKSLGLPVASCSQRSFSKHCHLHNKLLETTTANETERCRVNGALVID